MKSWKTTVMGVIAGLMILLGQLKSVIDDDPETQPNVEQVLLALGMMGLGVAARDGDKSSQDHGIRKE